MFHVTQEYTSLDAQMHIGTKHRHTHTDKNTETAQPTHMVKKHIEVFSAPISDLTTSNLTYQFLKYTTVLFSLFQTFMLYIINTHTQSDLSHTVVQSLQLNFECTARVSSNQAEQ